MEHQATKARSSESTMMIRRTLLLALTFATALRAQTAPGDDARFQRFDKNRTAQGRAPVRAAAPDGLVVKRDIQYRQTAGVEANLQSLDVYTTAGAKDRPVFLFVHGGSWSRGDKAMGEIMAVPIVARGYVFASANYRLIPPGEFPENAEDVAAAVAWLRQHAAEFGGDGKRLFISGHSAGCHLVSLVGTDPRFLAQHGLELDALSGVLALDTQMYDVEQQARKSGGKLRSPYAEAFGQDPEVWRAASPTLQAKPDTGIPPFAIAYSGGVFGGRAGPRKDQAEQFAGRLREVGARAVVVDAAEKTHGQIAQEFAQPGDKVAEAVFAFFEWIYEWPRPDNLEARDRGYPLGMRGLTAVPDPLRPGKESLLGGREIPGVIERIDPAEDHKVTLELDVAAFLEQQWGGPPIRHVTVAYNEITPATHPDTGEQVHLLGLWANHPDRTRPDLRNSAWYLVRHADLTYSLGRVFDPGDSALDPRYGPHGLRTICASPFAEDRGRVWYFGGFDQTGRMWGNQAWIYKATLKEDT